jgi:hypothetical protein
MSTFKPIRFDEGAPLDANTLNQLVDGLNAVFLQSNALYNSFTNNGTKSYKPVVFAGTVEASGITKDTPKDLPIPTSQLAGFEDISVNPIYITATLRGKPSNGEYTTVSVSNPRTTPTIWFVTNSKTRKSVTIDWVATQLVEVESNI